VNVLVDGFILRSSRLIPRCFSNEVTISNAFFHEFFVDLAMIILFVRFQAILCRSIADFKRDSAGFHGLSLSPRQNFHQSPQIFGGFSAE